MDREITDRYEREIQRRHEERLAFPLIARDWLKARSASARRGMGRVPGRAARQGPTVPSMASRRKSA
ncbi:hypothetical protein [Streptomyces sp. NBC_01262]|uniref:hypothetical protein n=1 Tax=Streptomyces sp. NBC_01262 TaxID=2903803 RepID=UPI002E322732|nr:hypothetical protein [Streptomyces sp. NBC_01262]